MNKVIRTSLIASLLAIIAISQTYCFTNAISESTLLTPNAQTEDVPAEDGEIRCLQWYPEIAYTPSGLIGSLEELKSTIPDCNYLLLKCDINRTVDTVSVGTEASLLAEFISVARQFGYKIILKMQMLDSRLFVPTKPDEFFTSYTNVASEYAIFAEAEVIEGFCFATEFTLLELPAYSNKWTDLVQQLRTLYSGELWYETNLWYLKTGELHSLEQKVNVDWFSNLDCIAVSAYWELANITNPTVATLVSNWHNFRGVKENDTQPKPWLIEDIVENLKNLSLTFDKKILLASGIASAEGACMTPWAYGADYRNVGISLEEQENWYEALFEVFHGEDWVRGFTFDGAWSTTPNHTVKKDFYIQAKPAQYIVKTWFSIMTLPLKIPSLIFSPAGGTYYSPLSVSLSCGISGASIRYTIDGSEPSSDSALYSNPILTSYTTTFKAKAFMSGMVDSDTASTTYTIIEAPTIPEIPTAIAWVALIIVASTLTLMLGKKRNLK